MGYVLLLKEGVLVVLPTFIIYNDDVYIGRERIFMQLFSGRIRPLDAFAQGWLYYSSSLKPNNNIIFK